MGCAIIAAALARGATVTAIHGPLAVPLPQGAVRAIPVESALEMEQVVNRVVFEEEPQPSVLVMAAAVSDYRVQSPSKEKLKRAALGDETITLVLEQNPDIIAGVAHRRGDSAAPFLVGFAVESIEHSERLIAEFTRKRAAKGVEILVGNRGDDAFDADTNVAYLIDGISEVEPIAAGKREVAEAILDRIVALRQR
jgi:phosphopantothenoylcysteine decarboxylase/phosphopantothenate--cysteine ligase